MDTKYIDKCLLEIQSKKVTQNESIVLAITGASLAMAAYNFYKQNIEKAARYCFDFQGNEKTKCMVSYRLKAHRRLISDMNSAKSRCKDDKCKMALDNKIAKLKDKDKELSSKLASVMNNSYGE